MLWGCLLDFLFMRTPDRSIDRAGWDRNCGVDIVGKTISMDCWDVYRYGIVGSRDGINWLVGWLVFSH